MKFNALLLLPIFMAVLIHQASSQNRFIVAIIERLIAMPNRTFSRCPATIITDRHVLTTGDCATVTNSSYQLAVQVQIIDDFISGSATVGVDRVFIHPNKTETSNNVAVVMIDGQFNVTLLPPRKLELTNSNATCTLYGWYGGREFPETVSVEVFSPRYCNPALPQTYCSVVASNETRACFAYPGSPLVCSAGHVSGILLSSNPCVYDHLNRAVLQYHSVGDYKAWIEEVSGAEITTKFSVILLVSAILITLKNFS